MSKPLSDKKQFLGTALFKILPAIGAFLVASIFILSAKVNPFVAFWYIMSGAFGSLQGFSEALVKSTPIILVGLGICIGLQGGFSNLGGEGQIIIGAIASTMVGIWLDGKIPPVLLFPLVMAAAMIAGGIWGGIAGFLRAKYGMNVVIVTIMLNYIAMHLLSFLLDGPIKSKSAFLPQTDPVPKNLVIPPIVKGLRVHFGLILAIALALTLYFVLRRTIWGYRVAALGQSPKAAEYAGVNTSFYTTFVMFMAGAFAGLAGMVEIYAIHFRIIGEISGGYGFIGMSAALLANKNPLLLLITSLFFGALTAGANIMQVILHIPNSIINITQGIIILFIVISPGAQMLYKKYQSSRV